MADKKKVPPITDATLVQTEDGMLSWKCKAEAEAEAIRIIENIPGIEDQPSMWERRGSVLVMNQEQYREQKAARESLN